MNAARGPMALTIVYGALAGLLFIPLASALTYVLYPSLALRLTLWALFAGYLFLLGRWATVNTSAILFPVLLLLALSIWSSSTNGFLLFSLIVLSWVRSGACFPGSLLRKTAVELLTCFGAAALVAWYAPHSSLAWAVGIWLFVLVQSLYFVMMGGGHVSAASDAVPDRFDRAKTKAEEILMS